MISRVSFENFKSLKNVSIDLGRFTVLVGPNGSGKSSVLRAIQLFSRLGQEGLAWHGHSHERLAAIFATPHEPWRLNSSPGPSSLKIRMDEEGWGSLSLELKYHWEGVPKTSWSGYTGTLAATSDSGEWSYMVPARINEPVQFNAFDDPRVARFSIATLLQLDSRLMTQPYVPDQERPTLDADGENLASVLAWLKGAFEDEFGKITEALRRIVPGVRRIRTLRERQSTRLFQQVKVDDQPVWRPVDETEIADRFEVEFDNRTSVPADLLSEGTVLALGLLTKLHEPGRPKLILLDDIDRGLHFEAQFRLVEVLRALLAQDPELQIVCTTHSPYLVDLMQLEEVVVLALDEQRQTHAKPLKDHPELEKWKWGTQTGELWAALGHRWVTETAKVEP